MASKVGNFLGRWAGRIRRRYSVMVHSDGGSGLRHYSMPGFIIPAVAFVGLACMVAGAASLFGWTRTGLEHAHVAQLQSENERLAGQIADIRRTVELFESRMAETAEMEQELRNLGAWASVVPRRSRSSRTRPPRLRSSRRPGRR